MDCRGTCWVAAGPTLGLVVTGSEQHCVVRDAPTHTLIYKHCNPSAGILIQYDRVTLRISRTELPLKVASGLAIHLRTMLLDVYRLYMLEWNTTHLSPRIAPFLQVPQYFGNVQTPITDIPWIDTVCFTSGMWRPAKNNVQCPGTGLKLFNLSAGGMFGTSSEININGAINFTYNSVGDDGGEGLHKVV